MYLLVSTLSIVVCVLLATCKTTASHKAPVKKLHEPCKNEDTEERSDSGNLRREDAASSTPFSNLNIETLTSLTLHNGSQHSSRKDIVVKDPEQLKVLSGIKDIRNKHIRKLMDSFQQGDHDVGHAHKVKQRLNAKHVKDQGVESVIHLLRRQALKAVLNLRKKIHNDGKLPELLSLKRTVKKAQDNTISTQDSLQSSRNKLFSGVSKLIHRIIQRKKKIQNDEEHHKVKDRARKDRARKAAETKNVAEQRSRQKSVRKVHNERADNFSPHNVYEYNDSDRKKAFNDGWSPLASQPLPGTASPADDESKWANWLDLHQFFNQMKGLPMEAGQKGKSMYYAPNSPDRRFTGMVNPSVSAAPLPSPFTGAEEFSTNAPKQVLPQQQNQMQSISNYFDTQALSRGGVQPALTSQPAMQGNAGLGPQASYPPDLSSVMQMDNPIASLQPFLSRYYVPSLPSRAANPGYFERAPALGPRPYQYPGQDEERNPDWNRDREPDLDDDEEEGPVPPDESEDRDEEASDPDDDEDDDAIDDGDYPYHRRQKSTIQLPLKQSKTQPRNVQQHS